MRAARLVGFGAISGFGFGQMTALSSLRSECPHAPGLVALSTFGPGMLVLGLGMIIFSLWRAHTSKGQV